MSLHYDAEIGRFRDSAGRFVSEQRARRSSVARAQYAQAQETIAAERAAQERYVAREALAETHAQLDIAREGAQRTLREIERVERRLIEEEAAEERPRVTSERQRAFDVFDESPDWPDWEADDWSDMDDLLDLDYLDEEIDT